jgi:hypothetical protein
MPPAFTLISCLACSSTLEREVTWSSETLVDFQRTTLHYIPEDRTLHNHRCENLKSYLSVYVSHSGTQEAKNDAADKIVNLCDPYATHGIEISAFNMTQLQCVKQTHSPNTVDNSICPSVFVGT